MHVKDYIPYFIIQLYKRINCDKYLYYFNSYCGWEEANLAARKYGDAYESVEILRKVAEATNIVREENAAYEQDGVVFQENNYVYEFLSSMFYILSCNESITMCDFGGALGSTFYRYKNVLPMQRIIWNVVEQEHFVEYGIRNIPELHFYSSFNQIPHKIDVVLLLSVLPYLKNPYEIINDLLIVKPQYIVIDETCCCEGNDEKVVLQHVPESIYKAVYPSWILNKQKLINTFLDAGYRKVFEWEYPGGAIPTRTTMGFVENIDYGFLFELD